MVTNMKEGKLYSKIRHLDKAWEETFDHTNIKKILDESKKDFYQICNNCPHRENKEYCKNFCCWYPLLMKWFGDVV